MKLICDCGNEIILELIDPDPNTFDRYSSKHYSNWADYALFTCESCGKKIRIEEG